MYGVLLTLLLTTGAVGNDSQPAKPGAAYEQLRNYVRAVLEGRRSVEIIDSQYNACRDVIELRLRAYRAGKEQMKYVQESYMDWFYCLVQLHQTHKRVQQAHLQLTCILGQMTHPCGCLLGSPGNLLK